MTSDEFQSASIALLRSALGWQSAIARRLGVDSRTVRRWLVDGAVPPWVDERFTEWLGAGDIAPWPRDEWMVGDARGGDGKRREYVVHLQPPRFVARVVAVDDDGDPELTEEPCDIVSGVVYASDGYLLCEIEWIDQPPAGQITQWLEAAAEAVDAA